MKRRNCPLCGQDNPTQVMQFSPELISAANTSYKVEVFRSSLGDVATELEYVRCQNCGMIYCPHTWEDDVLKKVYEDTIDHETSRKKVLSLEKKLVLAKEWERILRLLAIQGMETVHDLKIADFGCGWGDFLDTIRGNGVQSMGFDGDRIKIAHAKSQGHHIADSVDNFKAFGPVDVFVMNAVIEHVQDIDFLLKLANEMLKKGGLLVASTMDYRPGFLRANKKLLSEGKPASTACLNPVEHVNVYDYRSLKATVQKSGFRFFATDSVMELAGCPLPFLRNTKTFIRVLNQWQSIFFPFFQNRDRSITVYGVKA